MSPRKRQAITVLKAVVASYWAWVVWGYLAPQRTAFEAILILSAPLLLSLHFVQGLMFLRLLRGRGPWWSDFLQILVFGVLHLVPRVYAQRAQARPSAR